MTTVGLIVRLQAKPGKEDELADFLRSAVPLVQAEPATTAWFAVQIDASTFAIVDAFPDQAGRQAHLEGAVAAALFGKADDLLAAAPAVEQVDVLADVLPA
jgi:quinol monooxygenase YgiN